MSQLRGHPVEILSMESGESLGTPSVLIQLRPHSNYDEEPVAILFTQEQVVRLRDTLDLFLSHPDSSLFMSEQEQVQCIVEGE